MKRVIFSDNATLIDHTLNLLNYHSGVGLVDYVATEDYLYLGSNFAFNSFLVKMDTVNTQATTMSIDYWSGSSGWKSVVEIKDETSGLTSDGYVTFVPDKNWGWNRDDTVNSAGVEEVTGLGNVTIYDQYWIRVSFSVTMDVTTDIAWIGHLFCEDDDIYSEYPIFDDSTLKAQYETGKTTWEEQRVRASDLIVDDLISRGILLTSDQILERRKLMKVCVSKTAELIYKALGDDYNDDRKKAKAEYSERIKQGNFFIDKNNNARVDKKETAVRASILVR
jgi:hypothetical protein